MDFQACLYGVNATRGWQPEFRSQVSGMPIAQASESPHHDARDDDPEIPRHKKTGLGRFSLQLARPEGFEPPTPKFVAWCSIQLSYGRVVQKRNCAESVWLSSIRWARDGTGGD